MTVATPAARRLLMAALTACTLASGSLSHLTLVNPPPRLMFTAATGIPSCFCCSTCSSPATRSDANVVGDPKSFENTWTARICAPGPTPVRGRTPAAAPSRAGPGAPAARARGGRAPPPRPGVEGDARRGADPARPPGRRPLPPVATRGLRRADARARPGDPPRGGRRGPRHDPAVELHD